MWVVKLGGSLMEGPSLKAWLAILAEYGAGQAVIVPGGGQFADTVRNAQAEWRFDDASAHQMALHAMVQYGWMLAGLQPGIVPAASLNAIRAAWRERLTPVWLPVPMAARDQRIEASWRITSDSLALWLAGRLRARRLALIKAVAVPPQTRIAELVRQGVVDLAFAEYAASTRCAVFCLGPDDGERLALWFGVGAPPAAALVP